MVIIQLHGTCIFIFQKLWTNLFSLLSYVLYKKSSFHSSSAVHDFGLSTWRYLWHSFNFRCQIYPPPPFYFEIFFYFSNSFLPPFFPQTTSIWRFVFRSLLLNSYVSYRTSSSLLFMPIPFLYLLSFIVIYLADSLEILQLRATKLHHMRKFSVYLSRI